MTVQVMLEEFELWASAGSEGSIVIQLGSVVSLGLQGAKGQKKEASN
jgi:hypothetical protein